MTTRPTKWADNHKNIAHYDRAYKYSISVSNKSYQRSLMHIAILFNKTPEKPANSVKIYLHAPLITIQDTSGFQPSSDTFALSTCDTYLMRCHLFKDKIIISAYQEIGLAKMLDSKSTQQKTLWWKDLYFHRYLSMSYSRVHRKENGKLDL